MRIQVNISRSDIFKSNLYMLLRARQILGLFVFFVVGGMAYSILSHGSAITAIGIIVDLAIAIMCSIVGVMTAIAYTLLTIFFIKKNSGVLGGHVFEIRDDGLFEATDVNETVTKWDGIHSITKSGSRIYIRLTSQSFYVIPSRNFQNDDAFVQFHEALRAAWQTALNKA